MKRHGIIVRPSSGLGAAFNPGAAHIDGRFYLLARSVPKGYQKIGNVNEFDDNYNSHLSLWSGTSPKQFELVRENALMPDAPFDKYGVEDPDLQIGRYLLRFIYQYRHWFGTTRRAQGDPHCACQHQGF